MQKPKLYWVTTSDHGEDWFILAVSKRSAECFHISYEGYDTKHRVHAECILTVNVPLPHEPDPGETKKFPRHAQLDDLKLLGFTADTQDDPWKRKVRLGKRVFVEGGLESEIMTIHDHIFEAQGKGRPNGTARGNVSDEQLQEIYRRWQQRGEIEKRAIESLNVSVPKKGNEPRVM